MNNVIIELKNISKKFKKNNKEIVVLNNININFEKGKFYAIKGRSGCGKTTLINILGLISSCSSGEYILNGRNVSKMDDECLSKLRMNYIGFIFQEFYLNNYLKAYENVILPMIINNNIKREDRYKKAVELLNLVGLDDRIDHFPNELSGGEKQRVCIARSIANDPMIILADEPTGNLDKKNEKVVFEYLKKLVNEGKCVIVVSHSDEVFSYADVIYTIEDGEIAIYEK